MEILNVLFTGLVVVLIVLLVFIIVTKLCGVFCTWVEIESEEMNVILYIIFLVIYAKLVLVLVPKLYVLLL